MGLRDSGGKLRFWTWGAGIHMDKIHTCIHNVCIRMHCKYIKIHEYTYACKRKHRYGYRYQYDYEQIIENMYTCYTYMLYIYVYIRICHTYICYTYIYIYAHVFI